VLASQFDDDQLVIISKENIQLIKKINLLTFSMFVGHFCPSVSGSGLRIRICIQGPH
jgi:hypothetical protein